MTTNTNTGGPAFPHEDTMSAALRPGMTLRDYFAAKAMQASRARHSSYESWADLAKDAYDIADAMLKSRLA